MSEQGFFQILDSVDDDDLIQVIPSFDLGRATDGKWFARKSQIGSGSVSVTDAGRGNIIVNPTPGTNTFTLDLSDTITFLEATFLQATFQQILGKAGIDFGIAAADGQPITIATGSGPGSFGGNASNGGDYNATAHAGGTVFAGDGDGGTGGAINLNTGNGGNGNGTGNGGGGGDLNITLGLPGSHGTPLRQGLLRLINLPTSDPGISGALWNSAGTIKISP